MTTEILKFLSSVAIWRWKKRDVEQLKQPL